MASRVGDGDMVSVETVGHRELRAGDAVLCETRGREYLHLTKAAQHQRYLIGSNRGGTHDWVGRRADSGVGKRIERAVGLPATLRA
jgi:hypothetical protein